MPTTDAVDGMLRATRPAHMTMNKGPIHVEDRINERIQEATERLAELKDDVAKNLGRRVDSLGTLMKNHPFAAIGIGLGLGYLLARLLHR